MSSAHSRRPRDAGTKSVVVGTGFVALDVIVPAGATLAQACVAAGGTCGNVLAILAFLGWDSHLATRLGDDAASQRLRELFTAAGVDLWASTDDASARSPIVLQTSHEDRRGQPFHRFATRCPRCGTWWPSYRPITRAVATDVLITTQILALAHAPTRVFFFDRVSPAALLLAAEMRQQGTLVVFEPGALTPPGLLAEAFRQSDIVKYARDRLPKFEAALAAARRACSHWLLEIETRGADGLRFRMPHRGRSGWRHLPSIRPPRFVDGAGAGDWCSAVLIDGIGRGGYDTASRLTEDEITSHLMRAQAFSAASCGFAGSRGLMAQHDLAFAEQSARALVASKHLAAASLPADPQATFYPVPAWTPPCCAITHAEREKARMHTG